VLKIGVLLSKIPFLISILYAIGGIPLHYSFFLWQSKLMLDIF